MFTRDLAAATANRPTVMPFVPPWGKHVPRRLPPPPSQARIRLATGAKTAHRWPTSAPIRFAIGGAVGVAVCAGLIMTGAPTYYRPAAAQTQRPPAVSPAVSGNQGSVDGSALVLGAPVRAAGTTSPPSGLSAASALAADGIPQTALAAYQEAAASEMIIDPGCKLPWPLLAGIGRVESDHGRFGGGVLHTDGVSTPRIIGIALNGNGTALIRDTDHGRLDGDTVYDHAVGPMQFIPSTWAEYGVDANGDGVADPFNIFDAAATAARYLCAAGGDLSTLGGQTLAVYSYNHSDAYVQLVLRLEGVYAQGVLGLSVPIVPDSPLPAGPPPTVPPANPGPPLSATPPTAPPSGSGTPTSNGSSAPPSTTPSATSTPPQSPSPSDTGTGTSTPPPSSSAPPSSSPPPSTSTSDTSSPPPPPPSTSTPTDSPTGSPTSSG